MKSWPRGKSAGAGLDIKLARGGIRDGSSFWCNACSVCTGGAEPGGVRHGGTQVALFRLRDKSLLSGPEYARLASAYQFLRNSSTGCSLMRTGRLTRCPRIRKG